MGFFSVNLYMSLNSRLNLEILSGFRVSPNVKVIGEPICELVGKFSSILDVTVLPLCSAYTVRENEQLSHY